jgi:4-amino-4-deoxy-L-arabinose transferase-like glycosyltransferase
VLALIRKHRWWFLAATVAAVLMRTFFILKMTVIQGDSLVYGELAKCLATQHFYGLSKATGWAPTMIRMPGYPLYMAFTFLLFGVDHYFGAMLFQLFFDVLACFLVADLARRVFSEQAARSAFLLAAFCPFLLNYVATPLTECLETFCTVAALECAVLAFESRRQRWWALCGVAIAAAIYLRPDGGLLLGCIGISILLFIWHQRDRWRELTLAVLLLGFVSLAPLLVWTVRNYRVFHVIQPLVDPHATDPGEFIPAGFNRWCATWFIDYSASMDIGFPVPGEPIDVRDVPDYAYTSPEQRMAIHSLFDQYDRILDITPAMDKRFGAIADANIRLHPIRFHLLIPVARMLDMWFRPRTEMMPLDVHFWRFHQDPHDAWCSVALGALNLVYLAAAAAGAWLLRRRRHWLVLLLAYPIVRTLFLGYIGANEDRYTIECYPVVLILAAGFVNWWQTRKTGLRVGT